MSKNLFWILMAVIAGIGGAMLGPTLLSGFSPGTVIILFVVLMGAIIAYCIWAISKNKSAVAADPAAFTDARAMKASAGMARIYVTRRGFVAALQGMNIEIVGIGKSQIKSGQMLMAEVAPGTYSILSGTANAKLATPSTLEITVGADEIAVIDAMFEMGALKGAIKLTHLDGAKARENVNANKLMRWE